MPDSLTPMGGWGGSEVMELFSAEWRYILVMDPGDGDRFELPDHVSGIRFHFPHPTKTSRATNTDLG